MATKKKDPNDPSEVSIAYEAMAPKWELIEALLGGTESMRAAGESYLPKHAEETVQNYNERLQQNILFNMTELTLNAMVGRPFSDPLQLNDDVPSQIIDLAQDIDLQGNNMHVFARNWFREGLAKAFAHVFVDFPSLSEEERSTRTREDDIREKRRPYWQLVKPENLIFAAAENINGVEILTHVRIVEEVIERVGFIEEVKMRIRVLEPGRFELWELRKVGKSKKVTWVKIDEGNTGIPIVPVVTFYADRDGLMFGKPPLEDLAHVNVRHWQSTSDQINVLTVARFPILAVAGATDTTGTTMAIGPRQLLGTKDPNGRFYYVEHTGKAIDAGDKELDKLEDKMAAYGADFLRKRPGNITATARALDSAESTSALQDMTFRFIDAMHQVMDITAMWLGLDDSDGGTITLPTDFGPEETLAEDYKTLNEMRRNRDISRQGYFMELKRRGLLADDFDPEEDLDLLLKEKNVAPPNSTGRNINFPGPGGNPEDPMSRNPESEEDEEDEEDDG